MTTIIIKLPRTNSLVVTLSDTDYEILRQAYARAYNQKQIKDPITRKSQPYVKAHNKLLSDLYYNQLRIQKSPMEIYTRL